MQIQFNVRLAGLILSLVIAPAIAVAQQSKLNVLIVTVDDMSADSLGVFGCQLAETSPNIDAFARESLRFNHAHVLVGNCMPGRNIMWSGLYSHVNGVEGFVQNTNPDYPVLCDLAKEAGYFAAIRGKVSHSTPYAPYAWDAVLDTSAEGKKYHNKDAKSYGESTRRGIEMARNAGKPFCLMVNISDPHKPFYAQGKGGETVKDPHVPSRIFTAEEVPVPGFLPADDVIRKELAHYYSSVRRADDCFAEIMAALDQSGQAESTFVMFLSDHGMPLPFAKTQLYHHSTRTPLVIRWPGVTKPNSVDRLHMVSAVDFVPTLLEVMGHRHPTPDRLHGRSFADVIRGTPQGGREHVILQYNENSGRNRQPMRGIQTRQYLYLYSPWSDGQRKFATATTGTMTYRQMVKRAESETDIATRLRLFDHRVLEELYDVENDPDCLVNLAGDPDAVGTLQQLRSDLGTALTKMNDPVAPLVADVQNASLRNAYMAKEDARTLQARKKRAEQKKKAAQRKAALEKKQSTRRPGGTAKQRQNDILGLDAPKTVRKGDACRVVIHHKVPANLGPKNLTVTLKQASFNPKSKLNTRIQREVRSVTGDGKVEVEFTVPDDLNSEAVRVAVWIGETYETNLQYLNTGPIAVK